MTMTLSGTTGIVTPAGVPINNAPAFSAYPSVGTSMTNNVNTKILFQTEEFDTNSNYDTSTSRFTPTVAGYYYVTSTISAPTSGAGYFVITIYKNGAGYAAGPQSAAAGPYWTSVNALVYLNGSTDYVEIYAAQTTGGTITSYTFTGVRFQACLIRGA